MVNFVAIGVEAIEKPKRWYRSKKTYVFKAVHYGHKPDGEEYPPGVPVLIKSYGFMEEFHEIKPGTRFLVIGSQYYYKNPQTKKESWAIVAEQIIIGGEYDVRYDRLNKGYNK